MAANSLMVAGRTFRTKKDYEAALRDEQKIHRLKEQYDFKDSKAIKQLYQNIQDEKYHFESIVGNDFDDEVYELYQSMKNTNQEKNPENKGKIKKKKEKKSKTSKEKEVNNGRKINLDEYDADMRKVILEELKRQEKKRKWLVIVSSLVAVCCFSYFAVYYFYADRTSRDYEQLLLLKNNASFKGTSQNSSNLNLEEGETPEILEDFKDIYNKNKKLIGWLKIDDTLINYPVMQTTNNEYYLDHNFNQEYDKNGSIFLDCEASIYPRNTNLIIYGHHMKSGQMFGTLQNYAKESYYKEHSIIQFDTIYEKGTYKIMYAFRDRVYNENEIVFKYYQFMDADSEDEFNSNMKEMEKKSLYNTNVTASYGDELLTLSTCDSSQTDGRFVVVAKRID